MVVVLALIGIASAVVLPELASLVVGGPERTARELAGAYQAARGAAVARGEPVTVAIDMVSARYVVVASVDGVPADTLRQVELDLARGVRLDGGQGGWALTTFDPLGRARSMRVYIFGGDRTYELSTDPWTAEILALRR
jgi:Tfp pilus assembly protein FimT